MLAKGGTVVLSYVAFVAGKDAHRHRVVSCRGSGTASGRRTGADSRRTPLAARGLKKDGAFEVKDSSWVRDSFGGKGKHYVFTFKDALFECVAEGFGSETLDENDDAVRQMARRLYK